MIKSSKVAGAVFCTAGVIAMAVGIHPVWGMASMLLGGASYLVALIVQEDHETRDFL